LQEDLVVVVTGGQQLAQENEQAMV